MKQFLAMKKLLIAAVAALSMTGCATLQNNSGSARLVVSYATLKVIEAGKSSEAQAERALNIRRIASDAKSFLDLESVSLEFLQSSVRARLADLDLSPADRMLADGLVNLIVQELQLKVDSGVLSDDQRYRVSTVLGWVIDATGYVVT
jgi:hypothetical protein